MASGPAPTAWGGANWLTSGADQTVTITVDWSYNLNLAQAHASGSVAFANIYVGFWSPSKTLMLDANTNWVFVEDGDRDHLLKKVKINTLEGTGVVSGSQSWNVNVSDNSFYSFWGMADAKAWTVPEPSTAMLVGFGLLAGMAVARRLHSLH